MLFLFKNISALTTAGLSVARFFETTTPALLKICSLGTDVLAELLTLWPQGSVREDGSSVKPIGASLLSC